MRGASVSKVCFAKYNKNLSLNSAIAKIKELEEKGCIPIEYKIIAEIECDQMRIKRIIESGSINGISEIALLGIKSVQNDKGIWQCIVLDGPTESLIIYTGGTSEVMYYSIKL